MAGVIEQEPKALVVPKSPQELMEVAISRGASVAELTALFDLQMRWKAEDARMAWIEDMAAFKLVCPEILKTRHVQQVSKDPTKSAPSYWHAELDKAVELLVPVLRRHRFTHRWEGSSGPEGITVTCVIQHDLGHSERASLSAPPDTTGGKNAVQAVGSTKYYLERYTFFAALGIAPKGQDKDGNTSVSPDWLKEQAEEIGRCETLQGLEAAFKIAAASALEANDIEAYKALREAKNSRKKELAKGGK